jgi:hypothetical protein
VNGSRTIRVIKAEARTKGELPSAVNVLSKKGKNRSSFQARPRSSYPVELSRCRSLFVRSVAKGGISTAGKRAGISRTEIRVHPDYGKQLRLLESFSAGLCEAMQLSGRLSCGRPRCLGEYRVLQVRGTKTSSLSCERLLPGIISGRDAELIYSKPIADGRRDSW